MASPLPMVNLIDYISMSEQTLKETLGSQPLEIHDIEIQQISLHQRGCYKFLIACSKPVHNLGQSSKNTTCCQNRFFRV